MKSLYQCLIIDDEPMAIEVIQEHLEAFSNLRCAGGYTKPLEAIEMLNIHSIDLLFLDINMPAISGVDFVKSLSNPPEVVFTTAYRNFAVDAFELEALDYLVKPISFERFLKAVNKFFSRKASVTTVDEGYKQNQVRIILQSDKKHYKIPVNDILYAESLDNYVKVYTSRFSIVCYEKLSGLEKLLPTEQFVRIHRSYIVNLDRVEVFTSTWLKIGEKKFTIGRNYREEVRRNLRQNP